MTQFSLFEGDALNRVLLLFGIRARGTINTLRRILVLIGFTFLPSAVFCLIDGFGPGMPRSMNFFGDTAMLCQAFLGFPLFVIAESVISEKTRETANHFAESGIVTEKERPELGRIHDNIAKLRRRVLPDVVCLVIAFACSALWLWEETHNAYDTWHAVGAPGLQWPTKAGWWVALVGIPVFNYWWLRWMWKVGLWCWYLRKVSKLDLRLIASHPDLTGGLRFLSRTQASFAILIFAFGLGIIAPLLGYKLEIENADFWTFSVSGPLICFMIGAPAFFTIPLLFFTKRLARVKRRAIEAYQDRATEAALHFEKSWLTRCHGDNCDELLGQRLSAMNNLTNLYSRIEKMRVVPFDATSFTELTASTFGSLLPLLPKLFDLPGPVLKLIEFVKFLVGGE